MARRPSSGVIEPATARDADNPGGYFREPDNRPRIDAAPQSELGILGRLREALPLLSVGWSTVIGSSTSQGSKLGGTRHSSPERRVCRVNFPGITDDEKLFHTGGIGVVLRLVEGVDTNGGRRSLYVPLQGLAFEMPAGLVTLDVLQGFGNAPAADNTVNLTISHSQVARRWYTDYERTTSAVLGAWPTPDPFVAPEYATNARVTVFDGALASPVSGAPSFLAGSQPVFSVSSFGTLDLYGAVAGTVVGIEWEIAE